MSSTNVIKRTLRSKVMIKRVGDRIKEIRKKNNMTQQEFANSLGISRPHLSKIETSKENASDSVIKLISKLYSVSYDWLTSIDGTYTFDIKDMSDFEKIIKINHELKIGETMNILSNILNNTNVKNNSRKYYINNIAEILDSINNFYRKSDIENCSSKDIEILGAYIEKKMLLSLDAFKTENLDDK